MKKILSILSLILLISSISAINLEIEKQSSEEIMILDFEEPTTINLKITNLGTSDNFQFYNLLGFNMAPKGTVSINSQETKNIELLIYPKSNFDFSGFYNFKYFIKSQTRAEISKELTIEITKLKDIFEIGSNEINPESNSLKIYILNKKNFDFDNMNAKFTSKFFEMEEQISLKPNEKKEFEIKLNKEEFKELTAGFYNLNAEIIFKEKKADIEGTIEFSEKNILSSTQNNYKGIIYTKTIKKENQGNTNANTEIEIKKNIITRLFSTITPSPNVVERKGFNIYYTWTKKIKPGENLEVTVKTNWIFPLLLIFFTITIIILAKQYSKADLILRKKVTFVKTKGGEFALKISIYIKSKKYIEGVGIIDRLPPLVKVYEKFTGEKPTRINEKNRRIEWNFEKLEQGEIRILSYVIFSKVGVLGKFALPPTTALYQRGDEIREAESNKAFFVSEPRGEKRDEEFMNE